MQPPLHAAAAAAADNTVATPAAAAALPKKLISDKRPSFTANRYAAIKSAGKSPDANKLTKDK